MATPGAHPVMVKPFVMRPCGPLSGASTRVDVVWVVFMSGHQAMRTRTTTSCDGYAALMWSFDSAIDNGENAHHAQC